MLDEDLSLRQRAELDRMITTQRNLDIVAQIAAGERAVEVAKDAIAPQLDDPPIPVEVDDIRVGLDLDAEGTAPELEEPPAAVFEEETFIAADECINAAAAPAPEIEYLAPAADAPAVDQDQSLQQQAQELYYELSGKIAPYNELKQETGAFNTLAREASDISTRDREYIGVRLDADHIVEARFFEAFKDEFALVGVANSADMPAMAVPTETHIRKGDSLLERFEIADTALQELPSWTRQKMDEIGTAQEVRARHETLTDLLKVYKDLYERTMVRDTVVPYLQKWIETLDGR